MQETNRQLFIQTEQNQNQALITTDHMIRTLQTSELKFKSDQHRKHFEAFNPYIQSSGTEYPNHDITWLTSYTKIISTLPSLAL